MKYLKKMEEKRDKEREEDRKEREKLAEKIKEGVKEVIEGAMKPWKERTVRVEESSEVMGREVRRLAEEMVGLKE